MNLKLTLSVAVLVFNSGIYANSATEKKALSFLDDNVNNLLEQSISNHLDNIEVSVEDSISGKPTISILGIQLLNESKDLRNTIFGQYSLNNFDGRQTLNLGLAYRNMSEDERWLYGINAFYDHEFPYDHQRYSIGLDARSSIFEFNANKYTSISNWKSGENGVDESALDGHDAEVGVVLPYMPNSKLYHKVFKWNGLNSADDLKGGTTSLELSGELLIPGLTLELGRTNYDGTQTDKNFAKLTFSKTFGQDSHSQTPMFSKEMYAFNSMKSQRLTKVRRQNKIVKQNKLTATITGN
jgi:adhesin/invasin